MLLEYVKRYVEWCANTCFAYIELYAKHILHASRVVPTHILQMQIMSVMLTHILYTLSFMLTHMFPSFELVCGRIVEHRCFFQNLAAFKLVNLNNFYRCSNSSSSSNNMITNNCKASPYGIDGCGRCVKMAKPFQSSSNLTGLCSNQNTGYLHQNKWLKFKGKMIWQA